MVTRDADYLIAANPTASAEELRRIAATRPDLYPTLLGNPSTYPALREWITARTAEQRSFASPQPQTGVRNDAATPVTATELAQSPYQASARRGPDTATSGSIGHPIGGAGEVQPQSRVEPGAWVLLVAGVVGLVAVVVAAGALLGGVQSPEMMSRTPITTPQAGRVTPRDADARPPSPTQPATTARRGQGVTSLPSGSWITVLESLPKDEYTFAVAQAFAAELADSGSNVWVIDSDAIPGLNGGYWVLGVTERYSRDGAVAVCDTFGREAGGSCYPREVG